MKRSVTSSVLLSRVSSHDFIRNLTIAGYAYLSLNCYSAPSTLLNFPLPFCLLLFIYHISIILFLQLLQICLWLMLLFPLNLHLLIIFLFLLCFSFKKISLNDLCHFYSSNRIDMITCKNKYSMQDHSALQLSVTFVINSQ